MPAMGGLGPSWFPPKPYVAPKPPEAQDLDNVMQTVQRKVPTQTNQFGDVAITLFTDPLAIPIHWQQQKLISVQNVMGGSKPGPMAPVPDPNFVGPPWPPPQEKP